VLYPARRIRVFVGYIGILELPAIFVIGFWIVVQFMNGFGSIAFTRQTETGGVAYWAHIGGAVAGLLLVSLFRSDGVRRRALQRQAYPVRRTYYD
jgi:membrane associated rhomboid family serine protease